METIKQYLKKNQPRFVEELCEYVKLPSVSAQPQHRQDMVACAEWLAAKSREAGLEAKLCRTNGHPIVLASTPRSKTSRKPHYLVYGHYDVQPPEPFELWKSPPFEPKIVKGCLYARGASDNKGQHLAHLNAVEAYLKTGTELPCDITFIVEGEEEVGSQNLAEFLKANKAQLRCDGIIISDTGMPSLKHPALTCSLRGIAAMEIEITGPNRDLHSGLYGGAVDNPAMVLCQLLAQLRDADGRVTIPGFYDAVQELSQAEKAQLARLPFNEREYAKFIGTPKLFGEEGYTAMERSTARPTFEINGLTSGYQGEGTKTIIPSWARAKITMRLVANQKPEKILKLAEKHLRQLCPKTVRLVVRPGHGGEPYYMSADSLQAQAALRSLKAAFNLDPVLLREGGSIPIVNDFKKILGADVLLLGLALPDDNPHSPNEKFDLRCFEKGAWMGVNLWRELGALAR